MGKKGFKQFWAWYCCWCQTGWSEYSTSAQLLGFSRKTISRVYKEPCEKGKTRCL